jgi:hemoglobin
VGGYDAIYRIHLRFYEMMFEEPWLGRFFWGKHEGVLARKQTDFLVACLGGPHEYRGETPAIAHLHMFITEEMLDVRESLLRRAMAEAGLETALQGRWLRIDNAFRAAVAKRSPDECVMRCVGQVPIVAKRPADYRPPG